jgi:hypothetical protein
MALASKLKTVFVGLAILIGLLIAIPLIAALFIDNEFSVERQIIIEQPVDMVFDYVKYLRNQDNYTVWATLDPEMNQEFRGVDGTVGFVSAWNGNKDVGRGEQEIVGIVDGERIDYKLRFFEPFESKADAYMTTIAIDDNLTRVTWGFDSRMPYPLNLMLVFMDLDEAIGNDYQTGLQNLKSILETRQPVINDAETEGTVTQ